MKVFVVGANGKIGQHVVKKLSIHGDQVTAGVRQPADQAKYQNVDYRQFNLNWSASKMAEELAGQDAVIFVAGSKGQDLLKVDLDGAVKTMIATENSGISRYLLVSTVNADDPDKWSGDLTDYFIAKHYADEWLQHNTKLDYVIVRPVTLTDAPETNQVSLNNNAANLKTTVTRADVAELLVELTHRPELKKLAITISEGPMKLATAVEQLSAEQWKI